MLPTLPLLLLLLAVVLSFSLPLTLLLLLPPTRRLDGLGLAPPPWSRYVQEREPPLPLRSVRRRCCIAGACLRRCRRRSCAAWTASDSSGEVA